MAISNGLLGKMKLIFYPNPKLPGIPPIPFPLQYNPSNFSVSSGSCYDDIQIPLLSNLTGRYLNTKPRTVKMDLMFDGTGASPSNFGTIIPSGVNLVDVQVKAFLALACEIVNDDHEPFRVAVIWGTFFLTGVVTSADVTYNFFDRDGRPLRAKISVTIEEKKDIQRALLDLGLKSADITKSVTVVDGDTLPNLCQKEYGNPALYVEIARVNKLDNYRKLKPGMQLLFPPIKEEV